MNVKDVLNLGDILKLVSEKKGVHPSREKVRESGERMRGKR